MTTLTGSASTTLLTYTPKIKSTLANPWSTNLAKHGKCPPIQQGTKSSNTTARMSQAPTSAQMVSKKVIPMEKSTTLEQTTKWLSGTAGTTVS